jgi:hypothetical protein
LTLKDLAAGRLDLYSANDRRETTVPISETTRERDSGPRVIFSGLVRSKPVSLTDTDDVCALASTIGADRCTPNVTIWLAELEVCAQTSSAPTPTNAESKSMYRTSFMENNQFVNVSVTTRESALICPTEAFAANVYVIDWSRSLPFPRPETTSTGLIALDTSTNPLLNPFELSSFIIKRVPTGIGELMDATIFMLSRFVIMLYFE